MVMGKEMLAMMTWMEMVGSSSLPASDVLETCPEHAVC